VTLDHPSPQATRLRDAYRHRADTGALSLSKKGQSRLCADVHRRGAAADERGNRPGASARSTPDWRPRRGQLECRPTAWRLLPSSFGVSAPTAHRRFQAWTRAGVWPRLHRAVLDAHGAAGDIDWSSTIVDAASLRAKRGAR
jgi:hypothetical protein